MKREWRRNWIILTATIVHFIWGVVLLFSSAPLHTTPLAAIHAIPCLNNNLVSAGIYICVSICAFIPIVWDKLDTSLTGLLLALPQQFLLMISVFTAMFCIVHGAYPDGYVPDKYGNPNVFIFVDQLWPMIGMIAHTLSLLDWYWWSRKRSIIKNKFFNDAT